jgi:hypothetical protein
MGSPEAMAQVRLGRILAVGMGVGLPALLGLPEDILGDRASPPLWMVLVLGFVVVEAVGAVLFAHRMFKPLGQGLDVASARSKGVVALRGAIVLRLSAATMPALMGLGLAAIARTVTTPFLVMLPVSLALLAVAWPREALVRSVRDRLESTGAASYLVVADAVAKG